MPVLETSIVQRPVVSALRERQTLTAIRVADAPPSERGAIGYSARMFAVTCLPHSDPGNIPVWTRQNGAALLSVQQGYGVGPDGAPRPLGYPYGSLPRLLLLFLASEAIRTRSPKILLGDHLSEFFRKLSLPYEGRRITALKRQAERLFGASIRFTFRDENFGYGQERSIAREYLLWWHDVGHVPRSRTQNQVILQNGFFEELIAHGFPVDLDAIGGLRQSPLAIDLYCWLAHRIARLERPTVIPFAELQSHIGADYGETREFSRECKIALRRIRVFWRGLEYRAVRGGIELRRCPLPVSIR